MASGAPAAVAAAFAMVRRPLAAAGRSYNAAAQRSPFLVGTVTTVVKTSAADLFAQTVMEGKEWRDVDWKRHGLFCTFGLFYLVRALRGCWLQGGWGGRGALFVWFITQLRASVFVLLFPCAWWMWGASFVARKTEQTSTNLNTATPIHQPTHAQGGFQYYLYNHLFSRWCASITARVGHHGSAPVKTFIDQAIQ
jgi:hypothetical protein